MIFNDNDLLNYDLKYKEDNLVLDLVKALRVAYKNIARLPEHIADLVDENRHLQDKIIEQGVLMREARQQVKGATADLAAVTQELRRYRKAETEATT